MLVATDIIFRPHPYPERPEVLAIVKFTHGMIRINAARIVKHECGRIKLHMPERWRMRPCRSCLHAINYHDRFCCACGRRQRKRQVPADHKGRRMPSIEMATFETAENRRLVETAILRAWCDEDSRPRLFVPRVSASA